MSEMTTDNIQEVEEIAKMLESLPRETRIGFYYAIKGACLIADAQMFESGQQTA